MYAMCFTLSGFRAELEAFTAGFDPGLLAPLELGAALEAAGAIEKMASTLACLIAARMAATGKASTSRRQAARRAWQPLRARP